MDTQVVKICKLVKLTNAFQVIHTVYSTRWLVLKAIQACNTNAGANELQVCIVPPGGTASADNSIVWSKSIATKDYLTMGEHFLVPPGYTVQALCSVTGKMILTLNGQEE